MSSGFQPEGALLKLIARGSLLYHAVLVLMRFMPRRTGEELATMDLIFIVLIADKANLDISWFKDESLEESVNLPSPDIIAQEIVEDLEAALEQFREIEVD